MKQAPLKSFDRHDLLQLQFRAVEHVDTTLVNKVKRLRFDPRMWKGHPGSRLRATSESFILVQP